MFNPAQNSQALRPNVPVQTLTTLQVKEELKSAYKFLNILSTFWLLANAGAFAWLFFNQKTFQPTLLLIDFVQLGYSGFVCLFILSTSTVKTSTMVNIYITLLWTFLGYILGRVITLVYITDNDNDDTFFALVILCAAFMPVLMLIRSTEIRDYLKRLSTHGGIASF